MERDHSRWTDEVTDQSTEPASQAGGMRRAGRLTFKFALILGSVFFLFILGLSLITSFSLDGLVSVQQRMDRVESVLMWFRLLLIGALIGFWRPLNVWLAQRNAWSPARLLRVLEGRGMALGVLLFVELVLVQRFHEPLIDRMVQ